MGWSASQASSDLVGKTIKVFWRSDNKWYNASVCGYDSSSKKHHVKYDDGQEEHLDLQNEQYQVVVESDLPSAKKAKVAARAESAPEASSAATTATTTAKAKTKAKATSAKRRATAPTKSRKRISTYGLRWVHTFVASGVFWC